jgi:hypothetical protein
VSRTRQGAVKGGFLMPADVAAIWLSLDDTLVFDPGLNAHIAAVANCENASVCALKEQNRKALSDAHRILTDWCIADHREREENLRRLLPGLMETGTEQAAQNAFDGRILVLERALADVHNLVEPFPTDWSIVAEMVWAAAGRALLSKGHKASWNSKAIAIRFTSAVLGRLGYNVGLNGATPNAVSMAIRNSSIRDVLKRAH